MFEKKYLKFVAPLILICFFLIQIILVKFDTLNPWKGGGFGMFSSVEAMGTRVIRINGINETGDTVKIKLNFNESVCREKFPDNFIQKIKSYPKSEDLILLAECLSCSNFFLMENNTSDGNKTYTLANKFQNKVNTYTFDQILVEVLNIRYNYNEQIIYFESLLGPIKSNCDGSVELN